MSWPDAMGLIVLEGLIITVLVLTGFRMAVFRAIPAQLKTAIAVGIGLFLAMIGLVDAGIVRRPRPAWCRSSSASPAACAAGRCWSSCSAWRSPRSWSPARSAARILIGIVATTVLAMDRRGDRRPRARGRRRRLGQPDAAGS